MSDRPGWIPVNQIWLLTKLVSDLKNGVPGLIPLNQIWLFRTASVWGAGLDPAKPILTVNEISVGLKKGAPG